MAEPRRETVSELEFKAEEEERARRFDAVMARIKDGTTEEADFSSCSIGPERAALIAAALMADGKVTKLDLYDNQLGDEGLKALSGCIAANKKLRVLNLKWNGFGKLNQVGGPDNDAGVVAFAAALKRNKTIEQVNMEWNQIWEDGRKALAVLLSKKRYINCDDGLPNTGTSGGWNFNNPPVNPSS
mmetsp:Transcript_25849/g.63612  ORF Transcript_25849/g.63612 Transcript_25849/m.63612 type:complete len:186 (-) Transcript_25849:509-1066(-)